MFNPPQNIELMIDVDMPENTEELTEDESTETMMLEGNESKEEEEFSDFYSVEYGDCITSNDVVSIEMPKITIEIINKIPVVQRSPIGLILEDNQFVCSKLLEATTKKFPKLTIIIFSDEEKTKQRDVWEFANPQIKTVNFGQLASIAQADKRIIQCEVEYEKLIINGVKL